MPADIKTSILLGYECNNNCRFCYCADKRFDKKYSPMGTEKVKDELDSARERGSKWVDFLGGEPTIRNDIIELTRYASNIGFETISITTNGTVLSYREFAEKMVDAGLNHVIFSMHGHNSKIHDNLVRNEGAFKLLKEGIKNIVEINKDIYLCINTTIVNQNYRNLYKIPIKANGFASNNLDGIEFIFPHPRGNAWKNFEEVVPKLSDIPEHVDKAISQAVKKDIEHVVGRYIPFCYMQGNEEYVSEDQARGKIKEEHTGPEFQNLEVEKGRKEVGKVKPEKCKECKYYDRCEGIWKEYAEKRGIGELNPITD